jgi:hypothetical protein
MDSNWHFIAIRPLPHTPGRSPFKAAAPIGKPVEQIGRRHCDVKIIITIELCFPNAERFAQKIADRF